MLPRLEELWKRVKKEPDPAATVDSSAIASKKALDPAATVDSSAIASSKIAIDFLLRRLACIKAEVELAEGTSFLHFVYGFKQQEELPYYAYLAIRTAQSCNPDWPTVVCFANEPSGPWWDDIRPSIHAIHMPSFDYFMGARFYHYAHKADVVRLLMLRELGGIYLDMDTITVRSFTDLLKHDFGMAVQSAVHDSPAGLCNAVMWGRPNAEFLRIWLSEYGSFQSKGRDHLWDYHSVKLPGILAREHQDKITILNHRAFFYPLWTDLERLLLSEGGGRFLSYFSEAYGFHLWNGATEEALRRLSPQWIENSTSLYAYFARRSLGMIQPEEATLQEENHVAQTREIAVSATGSERNGGAVDQKILSVRGERMRKPLISIVMPTLNSERFIREALNSVVEQTYENMELVVVDGGSTDRTLEILSEYGKSGIKLIKSIAGKGISHDLNVGLAHAEGAFIARMDADDIAMNWRIEAQYKFLSEHSEIDLVGSGAELFWNASGECRSPLWPDHIRDMYLVNNPFFHPTIMFRRRLLDDGLFLYDETLKADEDYELWGRLITSIVTANMDCCSIRYRIHGMNSQRNPNKIFNKTLALERFCKAEGIYSAPLVDALAEFQVSSFITPLAYNILSIYARTAVANDALSKRPWPKLGWIQWALAEKPNYAQFMAWYTQAKGWKLGA